MKQVFNSVFTQIFILAVLIIIFWYPIVFNNEFFYDDWSFIGVFNAGTPNIGYFFAPHNEHFMPMFKLVFFALYNLFKLNIAPYMSFAIIMHIINSILFLFLLRLIFPKKQLLPFFLVLFFSLSTVYYETLHWFVNTSQAFMLFFFLLTLFLMHLAYNNENKKVYWASVVASFFIPMNSSFGFLSIVFIPAYYFLILKAKFSKTAAFGARFLAPYVIAMASYIVIYLFFSLHSLLNRPATAPPLTFDALKMLLYFILGYIGIFLRNVGLNMLIFPYSTGIALMLMLAFLFIGGFIFIRLASKKIAISSIGWFSIIGMSLCYAMLAFTRASLEPIVLFTWGRYHYVPMVFVTILLGAGVSPITQNIVDVFENNPVGKVFGIIFILSFIGVGCNMFSIGWAAEIAIILGTFTVLYYGAKIFNTKKTTVFLLLLLVLLIINQYVLLRQKTLSPIRTEGLIEKQIKIPMQVVWEPCPQLEV